MQIVVTTFLAIVLAAMLFFVRKPYQLAVFGIALPLGAAAAFNLPSFGNSSVIVPNFVAAALIAAFVLQKDAIPRLVDACRPYTPGFFLVIFIGISIVITVLSPRIFVGSVEVFGVARSSSVIAGTNLVPLRPTTANVTQTLYLLEGIIIFLVVVALCRRSESTRVISNGIQGITIAHLTLAALDMVDNILGGNLLLGWIRTANYAHLDHAVFAGLPRLVGGFPEASSFGSFTAGLLAFWLMYWRFGGRVRYAPFYILALFAALILSTSSGSYVAFGGFLVIMLPILLLDALRGRQSARTNGMLSSGVILAPVLVGGFFLALELIPAFYNYVDQLVFSKLESDSGVERSAWNRQAMKAFWDSYMMGVGVGSVRGSSFVVSILSTVGIFGTLAFAAFLARLTMCQPDPRNLEQKSFVGGAKGACLVSFLQASLSASNPDIGMLFFVFAATAYGYSVPTRSRLVLARPAMRVH